jgi:hypothetical protein
MLLQCATLALLPDAPPITAPAAAFLTPPAEKELRDPFHLPNVATSENFAVWWGDLGFTEPDDVELLLESFETAWAVHIAEMAHPPPAGTDTTRFTVVLGDTGDGAPQSYGTSGYFFVDPEGWPMVVIAASALWDAELTRGIAAHEFYHAVQATTGRYLYVGEAAWYWESTAVWASDQVVPHNLYNAAFLFAYAELPHLPVDFFDYPDTGRVEELFQYGSFVFPVHLSEIAGYEVIRDSWVVPGTEPDPLETLRELLRAQGIDLDETWLDHVARNVTWDYADQDLYQTNVGTYDVLVPGDRIAVELSGDGTTDTEVDGDQAPRRYGYSLIRLEAPMSGRLLVEVVGEEEGSRGRPAQHGARVVRVFADGTNEVLPVPFDGHAGALTVEEVGDEVEIWLAVGAWTEELDLEDWVEETFPFTFTLWIEVDESDVVPPTPEADDGGGCSCSDATPGGAMVVLLLPVALSPLRRRGPAACPPTRR